MCIKNQLYLKDQEYSHPIQVAMTYTEMLTIKNGYVRIRPVGDISCEKGTSMFLKTQVYLKIHLDIQ